MFFFFFFGSVVVIVIVYLRGALVLQAQFAGSWGDLTA